MSNKKNIHRNYRIKNSTDEKIKTLVSFENAENFNTGSPNLSDADILEMAIDYYYSCKLGKEVFHEGVSQLEMILTNSINLVMKSYADEFAKSLNYLNRNDEIIKKILSIVVKSIGMLDMNKDTEELIKIINNDKDIQKLFGIAVDANRKN